MPKVKVITNELFNLLKERIYMVKDSSGEFFGFFQVIYYHENYMVARMVKFYHYIIKSENDIPTFNFYIDRDWVVQHPYSKLCEDPSVDEEFQSMFMNILFDGTDYQLSVHGHSGCVGKYYQFVKNLIDEDATIKTEIQDSTIPASMNEKDFSPIRGKVFAIADHSKKGSHKFTGFYQPFMYNAGLIRARILKSKSKKNKNGTISFTIDQKWFKRHPNGFVCDTDFDFVTDEFGVAQWEEGGKLRLFQKGACGNIRGDEVPVDHAFITEQDGF